MKGLCAILMLAAAFAAAGSAEAQQPFVLIEPEPQASLSEAEAEIVANLRSAYGAANVVITRTNSPYDASVTGISRTPVQIDLGQNRRFQGRLSQTAPGDGALETWSVTGLGGRASRFQLETRTSDDGGEGAWSVSGGVIVGRDVVRSIGLNDQGRSAVVTIEGAALFIDHPEAALSVSDGGARSHCTHKDNEIRIGWAITGDALRGLTGQSTLSGTPSAITDALRALNTTLAKLNLGSIHFTEQALSNRPLTWPHPESLSDALTAMLVREDAQTNAIWELANDKAVDIVVLIAARDGTGAAIPACGVAEPYASADRAVLVFNQQCIYEPRYTLAHEISHIFGACHEPARYTHGRICPPDRPENYRFGWRDPNAPQGSIEAEWGSTDPDVLKGFARLLRFSQSSTDDKPGPSTMDVSRLVRERAPEVSGFAQCRGA